MRSKITVIVEAKKKQSRRPLSNIFTNRQCIPDHSYMRQRAQNREQTLLNVGQKIEKNWNKNFMRSGLVDK